MTKTILVPLDGSRSSENVLPIVIALAAGRQAKIVLLHVLQLRPPLMPGPRVAALVPTGLADEREEQRITEYLSGLVPRVRSEGVESTSRLARGSVTDQIIRAARTEQADVIVMSSTRTRHRLFHLPVSERLRRLLWPGTTLIVVTSNVDNSHRV